MQHIIAPFDKFAADAWHEDIWHAFRLAMRFERQQLAYQLWATEPLSAASLSKLKAMSLSIKFDIQQIQPYRGIAPNMGNLWIVGDIHIGSWYDYHQYQTISVIYDTMRLDSFFQHLHRLRKKPSIELKVIHISKSQEIKSGVTNSEVEFDLLDINFWNNEDLPQKTLNSVFTVGRISPDFSDWHHYHDPSLYNILAQRNFRIKLAGADSIKSYIESNEKFEFYDSDFSMQKFISSIDCLICRSSPKKPKNFMPSISLAIKYDIPIIIDSRNSLAEHLSNYPKAYISNCNDKTLGIINVLSQKDIEASDQGGDA
ncbi:MAG TPA: hypothetical protein VK974_10750 [Methylophilaceae bacterium]|nr:hypothetical protein [Methylophilaceae bacterium]